MLMRGRGPAEGDGLRLRERRSELRSIRTAG